MRPATPATPLEGRTVLLLEDESLIVLDLRLALEEGGARVLSSTGADGALALLGHERPDAAVLDLTLGGGRTCEAVARHLETRGVPYLLHTGDADRHRPLIARLGAPLISKPFPSHLLAGRVAALLDRRAPGAPR